MATSMTASNAEVDRLSFDVLRGAYIELANVLKLYRPGVQGTVLRDLEEQVVAALSELIDRHARNGRRDGVAIAVGERLHAVLDEARAPIPVDLAPLDERLVACGQLTSRLPGHLTTASMAMKLLFVEPVTAG